MKTNNLITFLIPEQEQAEELHITLLKNTFLSFVVSWSTDGTACISVHPEDHNYIERLRKTYDKTWSKK